MKYLYFSAPWCGPCRTLGPTMEQVAEQVTVEKINADEDQASLSKYAVRNVPTVILVDASGALLERLVGIQPAQTYLDKFKEHQG